MISCSKVVVRFNSRMAYSAVLMMCSKISIATTYLVSRFRYFSVDSF